MNQKLANTLLCLLTFLCPGCDADREPNSPDVLIYGATPAGIAAALAAAAANDPLPPLWLPAWLIPRPTLPALPAPSSSPTPPSSAPSGGNRKQGPARRGGAHVVTQVNLSFPLLNRRPGRGAGSSQQEKAVEKVWYRAATIHGDVSPLFLPLERSNSISFS